MPSGARVIMRPLAHKELENSVGKVDCNASVVLDTADGLSGARGDAAFALTYTVVPHWEKVRDFGCDFKHNLSWEGLQQFRSQERSLAFDALNSGEGIKARWLSPEGGTRQATRSEETKL